MTKTIKEAVIKSQSIAAPATNTKDNGAVQVGGAAIRFASTKDAGSVHVGGAAIRF